MLGQGNVKHWCASIAMGLGLVLSGQVANAQQASFAPVLLVAQSGSADDITWNMAKRLNTDAAYLDYLKNFPSGAHRAEALAAIDRLTTDASAPAKPSTPAKPEPVASDSDVPPTFVATAAAALLDGDTDRVMTFVTWSKTPQGVDFWAGQRDRVKGGGELTLEARSLIIGWLDAAGEPYTPTFDPEDVPGTFSKGAAKRLLDGDDDAIMSFVTWSETPQGSDFWIAEKTSISSGGELSGEARSIVRGWLAASSKPASDASKLPPSFSAGAAKRLLGGDADAIMSFVTWSQTSQGSDFWIAEKTRLQSGEYLSVKAQRAIQGWLRDSDEPGPWVKVPNTFVKSAGEELLEGHNTVSSFVTWSETPQGRDFWVNEQSRMESGEGLTNEARLAVAAWVAADKD